MSEFDEESTEFDKESREFKEALAACRKELEGESDEVLASCAETTMLKKILLEKFKRSNKY